MRSSKSQSHGGPRRAAARRPSEHRASRGTGHAHHFLSRLDRVTNEDLDLALWLYRHAELLRLVIEIACLPPHVGRVAVSLDHPTHGPFLIITRSAHFITCLGRGMRPGRHPVIARELVDRVVAQSSSMKR